MVVYVTTAIGLVVVSSDEEQRYLVLPVEEGPDPGDDAPPTQLVEPPDLTPEGEHVFMEGRIVPTGLFEVGAGSLGLAGRRQHLSRTGRYHTAAWRPAR